MLAGVGVNFALALFILTAVALTGMPRVITKDQLGESQFTVASDTTVIRNDVLLSYVEDNSPASKAGLQPGDQLIEVRNPEGTSTKIDDSTTLPGITKSHPGQAITIVYERDNIRSETAATLRSNEEIEAAKKAGESKGYLGVSQTDFAVQRSTWSAPIVAVGLSVQMTKLTFKGLWTATKGLGSLVAGTATGNQAARSNGQAAATEQVSGPVGIFMILKQGTQRGFGFVLFIIGIISLTLAIMNVLPIPALDGGRFYLILFSRLILKRPLSQKAEERIVGTAFMALMGLFVLITIVDVRRFW
jgi:regulator of sigma E protease